jgi:hypothetical protein
MKQQSNPSFEKACLEALQKARTLGTVPMIVEAVNRASMLIALSPEKTEEIFREKIQEGIKL